MCNEPARTWSHRPLYKLEARDPPHESHRSPSEHSLMLDAQQDPLVYPRAHHPESPSREIVALCRWHILHHSDLPWATSHMREALISSQPMTVQSYPPGHGALSCTGLYALEHGICRTSSACTSHEHSRPPPLPLTVYREPSRPVVPVTRRR